MILASWTDLTVQVWSVWAIVYFSKERFVTGKRRCKKLLNTANQNEVSCSGVEFRSVILVLFRAGKIFGWPLPVTFYITLFCKYVRVFLKTTIANISSPEFHGQRKRELECPKLETSFTSVFDIFFVCSPLSVTFEWILLKETRIFCK